MGKFGGNSMASNAGKCNVQQADPISTAAEVYGHAPVADATWVRAGANEIVVTLTGAGTSTIVTDLELRYDYQNDYLKLWQREPVKLNE